MKKILNLFSLFFTVISICATALVCHILFIYPNFSNNVSQKRKDISSPNTVIIQTGNNDETANIYQDDYLPPETVTVDIALRPLIRKQQLYH